MSSFYDLSKTPRNILNQAIVRAIISENNGAWFDPEDLSTMFQDAAGTTPVTALEQPVGLWLDKSQGLELGPELVTNGDFSNGITGWGGAGGSISAVDGKAVLTAYGLSSFPQIYQNISTIPVGIPLHISWSVSNNTTTRQFRTVIFNTTDSVIVYDSGSGKTSGDFTSIWVAGASLNKSYRLIVIANGTVSAGLSATFDNISVRELKGNRATQSITASRPTLSARYNLLTKTGDFANAAWVKRGTAVLGSTAPDGTGKLISGLSSSENDIYQYATVPTGVSATPQIEIWPVTITGVLRMLNPANYLNGLMDIDLSKLTAGVWNKITPTHPAVTTVNSFTGYGGASGIHLYGKDNLSVSAYFRFPQLTIGTTPLPYQRVNTATDYDTVGFKKYIKFDGVDDYLNIPYMGLYANGAASIVAARDALSQTADTYVISERSTSNVNPKYFPSRQLANAGNMDSYIVNDATAVVVDTVGSAYGGASDAVVRSAIDSGNNIKLFKNGALAANENYTRSGALTLTNTTIGASVSTTTSNYANMKLYGLCIAKSALSDLERRRVERLLAYNGGVQL